MQNVSEPTGQEWAEVWRGAKTSQTRPVSTSILTLLYLNLGHPNTPVSSLVLIK